VYPFERAYLDGRLFESPYGLLREMFAASGVLLETTDRHGLDEAERVLFFNYNRGLHEECLQHGLEPDQLVLFAFEPPVVIPEHDDRDVWARFGMVFTPDDRAIDGTRVRKLRYPQAKELIDGLPSYEDRRLLTLINANKQSYGRDELYSLRRKAIRFFERRDLDFEFYGWGWAGAAVLVGDAPAVSGRARLLRRGRALWNDHRRHRAYGGSIVDKFEILRRFRFSICFENQDRLPGYITEKIFDCLVCGTVPIYLGAPNIADYLPEDCYIDMRALGSFEALASLLHELGPADVAALREAGENYLRSPAFRDWQPEAVFESFVSALV
jgi:alpha(1,3/1,4) fucosyltransferase